ncbi:MAG TPA: hypothetical protein VFU21_11670, partial [Kofleriaceae bacterium]|nr:hypothetical protein [Kofleriaceae bacterium]
MTRGRTSDGRRRFSTVLALALVAAVARVGAAAPSARSEVPPPTTAVVFGATGDLAKRKVFPALLAAWRSGKLPRDFQIVAAARDGLGRDEFLARLRTGMKEVAGLDVAGDAAWAELEKRIAYREVDLASLESVKAFGQDLDQIDAESGRQRLLYLAITPSVLGTAADHLGRAGILASRHGRGPPLVLVEKPFGRDAKSARRLNRALASHISLGMVMRMDHYLGKPAIEDLRRLRASDPAF